MDNSEFFFNGGTAEEAEDPAPDYMAFWTLDTDNTDSSSNQYDGVNYSMTYDGSSGQFSGGRIEFADNLIPEFTTSMSFSIWAKGATLKNTSSTGEHFLALYDKHYVYIDVKSSSLRFGVKNSSNTSFTATYSTAALNDTDWFYIVATADISTAKLNIYVNKVNVAVDVAGNYSWYKYENTKATARDVIGGIHTDTSGMSTMDGHLSNFRIYERVISEEEIEDIYDAELAEHS